MVGRLFVAVPFTEEARHAVAAVLGGAGIEIPGKAVPPDNWHLTIRFLGQTDEVTYERVLREIGRTEFLRHFDVSFDELGAFPNPRRAAVLWIGVGTGVEALEDLAGRVQSALERAGFEPEDRPFRAHLTLARIRPPSSVEALLSAAPAVKVRMPVERVVVYESHLGRPSARYEELESFPLP